ncbi:MAG TPA: glycogen-binding domain-containing protein [Elusimicrobiota bacterium]|nr:glycogen-binding domain-containing protein [Elusimicrobiota bacterium]
MFSPDPRFLRIARPLLMSLFILSVMVFLWTPFRFAWSAYGRFCQARSGRPSVDPAEVVETTPWDWVYRRIRPGVHFQSADGAVRSGQTPSPGPSDSDVALPDAIPSSPSAVLPDSSKKERQVVFRLLAPAAKSVFLGGSFNNFDARRIKMSKMRSGVWETTVKLPPGKYLYKFKVDGRWELDPTNPDKTAPPKSASLLVLR